MEQDRLAQIRERVAKASDGPWGVNPMQATVCDTETTIGGFTLVHNAAFAACAREDVPYLLARVAQLEADKARLERASADLLAGIVRYSVDDPPHATDCAEYDPYDRGPCDCDTYKWHADIKARAALRDEPRASDAD